jgi:hypothetical protein
VNNTIDSRFGTSREGTLTFGSFDAEIQPSLGRYRRARDVATASGAELAQTLELLLSRLVNREARSGESTLSPDQFEEASRVAELMQPGDSVVSLVDVTPVNRTRNFHNFSLETPEYFDDLFLRLSNKTNPRSRLLYQIETPDGRVYSVLTRGR